MAARTSQMLWDMGTTTIKAYGFRLILICRTAADRVYLVRFSGQKVAFKRIQITTGTLLRRKLKQERIKGIFKYGIGRVSNAVGATPFGSGRAPTGIAGTVAGGGIMGSALGMEYTPRDQMFGEGVNL